MDDIKAFLSWYLHPRQRMGRATFNMAFFAAFLPLMVIQLSFLGGNRLSNTMDMLFGARETVSQLQGQGMPSLEALQRGDLSQVTQRNEADVSRQIDTMLSQLQASKSTNKTPTSAQPAAWKSVASELLSLLMWLAVLPLILMRLRDMGKRDTEQWVWVGVIYAGVAGSLLKLVGLTLPLLTLLNVLGFLALLVVCGAGTASRKPRAKSSWDDA